MKSKILLFLLLCTASLNAQDLRIYSFGWGTHGMNIPEQTSYEFSYSVLNYSNFNLGSFKTEVYLTDDGSVDPGDVPIYESRHASLNAVQESHRTVSRILPPNITAGVYYLIILIDTENEVAEWDENNNFYLVPFFVIPRQPDMVFDYFQISGFSFQEGQNMPASLRLKNIGDVTTPGNVILFVDFELIEAGTSRKVSAGRQGFLLPPGGLSPGSIMHEEAVISLPNEFTNTTGSWEVRAVIDDVIQENDYSNNDAYDNIQVVNNPGGGGASPPSLLFSRNSDGDLQNFSLNEAFEELTLYPVPARNEINVALPVKTDFTVYLRDASGQLKQEVFVTKANSTTLNIGTYTQGMYLIQVKSPEYSGTKKFMIQ